MHARVAFAALLLGCASLLSGCGEPAAETPHTPIASSRDTSRAAATPPEGRGFDFYVLSLSWSPSYCAAEGEDANRQQCNGRRPYAFVVHGLWPQFERGYPEDCATFEPDVSRQRLSGLYDIMPSAGLIRHQWRKHGACAGLSQADYFDVMRAARIRVTVPDGYRRLVTHQKVAPGAVEQAFLDANPAMEAAGIAVTCDRRYLREVRICMTKALEFRQCPEVDRRDCGISSVVMPPVRGG